MTRFKMLVIASSVALLGACVVRGEGPHAGAGPGIAYGYSDGYWDRNHQWHAWGDQQEAETWRRENPGHYYERRHDVEPDGGWREGDEWWGRR